MSVVVSTITFYLENHLGKTCFTLPDRILWSFYCDVRKTKSWDVEASVDDLDDKTIDPNQHYCSTTRWQFYEK